VQNTLLETLSGLLETGQVLDATVASNQAQRAEMWRQREMAFEVATYRGRPMTTDICVPLDKVGAFLDTATDRLKPLFPRAEPVEVAHLGDGNLHYTIWPDRDSTADPTEDEKTRFYTMVEDVVQELHGSFSAEHGIGKSKLGSMARRKNPAALAVMRTIKSALDPNNIMNPGKVLP